MQRSREGTPRSREGTPKESKPSSNAINYNGRSLSIAECKELCKEIVKNATLQELRFSDCLLSEDLTQGILNALAFNTSIRIADFKGNNFRQRCAENLCKLLKQNTTLKELYLEWNALGLYDTSVAAFAEGLAVNKSLQVLDLSNNQICHTGARLVGLALKRNATLQSLDLRWNNIGIAGGREILSALQHNKSLISLQLAGNNIPSDTLKAISTALQRNVDYHSMHQQHASMTQSLKDEIDHLRSEQSLELTHLADELEREKENYTNYNHTIQGRLDELNETLAVMSRDKQELLESNAALQNDVTNGAMKISSLEESLADASKCNAELRNSQREMLTSHEELVNKERKQFQSDMAGRQEEISHLQKELKTLQEKIDTQVSEISNLKKVIVTKDEDRSSLESKHQREKEMLRRENEEQMKTLSDRNLKFLKEKDELEEEMIKFKTSIVNNKLAHEEELVTQKATFKQEEILKIQSYEEKIAKLSASNDELQTSLSKMGAKEKELQEKLLSCQKDIENSKQMVFQHQETLSKRDQDHREETNRFHSELDTEKRLVYDLKAKMESLDKTCIDLKAEIEKQKSVKNSELSAKDGEISSLRETVKQKEDEIRRNHQDELNRTNLLESALQTYIISARASKH